MIGRLFRFIKARRKQENNKSSSIGDLLTIPEPLLRELEAMGGVDGEAEAIRRRRRTPLATLPPRFA